MSCNECISQEVCFLQKQIGNLADRMLQPPFNDVPDTGGDRTKYMFQRHKEAIIKRDEICRELWRIIASNCSLFRE